MPGFFDTLKTMGSAHMQHVDAIHTATHITDTQAARDCLSTYLRRLSDASFAGFRVSLGLLLGSETQAQVRQSLQWIQANADALRAGQFDPLTPQTLPPHGLSIQQVTTLIEPWVQLSPQQAQQQFVATMTALDAQGRNEFATHVEVLAVQARQQLQQMQDNESNAWGSNIDDRIAYLQARVSTRQSDPAQSRAQAQQQALVDGLVQLALMTRSWRPPPAAAARAVKPVAASTSGPDLSAFPAQGEPSEQMAFMRQLLDHEKSRGKMDPARAAALTDFVDDVTSHLRQEEDRQARQPVNPNDRAALEADLRERTTHVAGMRERLDRFRDMHREVRRTEQPPEGSRAAALAVPVSALIDDVSGLLNSLMLATREGESSALQALHLDLMHARTRLGELGANDDDVLRYEADTLRPTAQALRLFHRRGHAMVARPIWPGGPARSEPSSVMFAGCEALRATLAEACASRRLTLREASQAGVEQATWLWRGMQRAGLAVIDLSPPGIARVDQAPEIALAQTYYQLGQAYALGTELLLIARTGTPIPFDVAQFVLNYRDEDDLARQLPATLDGVLYGIQTHGLSALMHGSLERCRDLAAKAAGLAHAGVLLSQLEASVSSPIEFRAALDQFLGQLGNSRLVLLHPRWPAHYPSATQRRCFVVMPFAQTLLTTQTMYRRIDADLSADGVEVVRGDEAVGQEIVASIWEETARASHVLVDLTNYNLNVCLELGMADAMGRDTLLIGTEGTSDARFPAIDKRRIHHYGENDASQKALRDQVRAFVQRAATLG